MSKLSKAAWHLTDSLKRTQLQRIATLIGAPLTGTKPQLIASINDLLDKSTETKSPRDGELRVLSIDMGIRNLAYAFLTSGHGRKVKPSRLVASVPTLCAWQRTNLLQESQHQLEQSDAALEDSLKTVGVIEHDFEPSSMAHRAYSFVKHCLELKPTHILIERQRFRSGGHSAVQEWTLRVGMLEAMLHATFLAFNKERLTRQTNVMSVLPMRVNKFWFIDEDVPATGKQAKLAKIALVSEMLRATKTPSAKFEISDGVLDVIASFSPTKTRSTKSQKTAHHVDKLDDMSDALLQGLAWLEWQKNRQTLLEQGPVALGIEH